MNLLAGFSEQWCIRNPEEGRGSDEAPEEGFNWLDPLGLEILSSVEIHASVDVNEQGAHQTSDDSNDDGNKYQKEPLYCHCLLELTELDESS